MIFLLILLGVALHREKYSFPVGKVIMKTMYPLRFDEFLEATGKGYYVKLIWEHFENNSEMPEEIHKELMQCMRHYLFGRGIVD